MAVYRHGITYDVGIASRSQANAEAGKRALLLLGEQGLSDRAFAVVDGWLGGASAVQQSNGVWVAPLLGWEPYTDIGGDQLYRAWGVPERVAPDYNALTITSQGTTVSARAASAASGAVDAVERRVSQAVSLGAVAAGSALAIPAAVMVGGAVVLALIAFVWLRGGAPGAKVLVSAAKGGL